MNAFRLLAVRGAALVFLCSAAFDSAVWPSDWLRFRGPNGAGVVTDAVSLPVEFAPEGAEWSQQVLFGRSSPIVANGLVFLTGLDGQELITAAHDLETGAERWRRAVPRRRVDQISSDAGPAVATPVSDGEHVYAFFPEFGLVSYDAEGKERWRLELPPFASYYGLASSPIVEGGVLILLCDQTRSPYLLGVDTKTGKELWRHAREVRAESWTTPVVHRSGTDQARVLTFGTFVVDAFDPRTGERIWQVPGLGATPVASPVLDGDLLYVVAPDQQEESAPPSIDSFAALDGDGDEQLTADEMAESPWASAFAWLDIDGDGRAALTEIESQMEIMASPDYGLVAIDVAADKHPKVVWRQKKTLPYIASPIVYRGTLYLIKDGGILTSYEPATGAIWKRGRLAKAVEPFSPSPVAADGKLYLTSSVGTVVVVRADAEWETLAVNDLDEQIFATPAIAGDRLIVRTRSKLYSFRGPQRRADAD